MIYDVEQMPGFNPDSSTTGRGRQSVSAGLIMAHGRDKVACARHGACLCVNADRTLWRCPACNEGAYVPDVDALMAALSRIGD